MDLSQLLMKQLARDCFLKGRGRKKWWADRLGVPPLTLSHWLSGRQRPNGYHAVRIKEILDQAERDKKSQRWQDYLWDSCYKKQPVPSQLLPMVILEILTLSTPESRTWALLSKMVEENRPRFDETPPQSPSLRNQIGWLLEVSGLKAPFSVDRRTKTRTLLRMIPHSSLLKKYLRHHQTRFGKKWRIYDFPLEKLKSSLP